MDLPSDAMTERLTRREQAILAYLEGDKSYREIADQEILTLGSVKWYIQQIYAKLGVKRRSKAIERARELGLLKPDPARLLLPKVHPRPKHNLPAQLTSFIGREKEIGELRLLLLKKGTRLLTLTGAGGTGKTRLALQVAGGLLEIFPDGVWLAEFAPLADPALVPQTVISALGLMEQPGRTPIAQLADYLRERQLLLILDNCEHLVTTCAEHAASLLQAAPRLTILATSREILGVNGESPYRCPSLSLPKAQGPQLLEELARSEAVSLFVERAASVSAGFSLTEENSKLIARICRRLDGIPLAIELAAARVRLLSIDQIAARLDNIFRLLTGGSRTNMPRHQTLKALIDWSYNLLSEKERLLLLRLSVFAGGWTLEAAEAVCADPPDGKGLLPTEEILDLLGQLVDKSLAEAAPFQKGDSPRYRMLETIRQYAHDRLVEREGGEEVRERHLDYFLALCLRAEIQLHGKYLRVWREKLDAELDNLRLGLEWAESGTVEKGLRLAAALYLYWFSYLEQEGMLWLERLLAAETAAPDIERSKSAHRAARGKALNALADIGGLWGRDQTGLAKEATAIFEALGDGYQIDWAVSLSMWSEKDLRKVLTLFRQIGDPYNIVNALWPLIVETLQTGNLVQARAYAQEDLALCHKMEYLTGEKILSITMWYLELLEGNLPPAREYMKAAQEYADAAGESGIYGETTLPGWMALFHGNYIEAYRIFQEDLSARQEKGLLGFVAILWGALGRAAWAGGEYDLAERHAQEGLRLTGRVSDISLRGARYVLARTAIVRCQYESAFAILKDSILNWSGNGFVIIPVQLVLQTFGILSAAQSAQPGQARRAAVLFGSQDFISLNLMNVMTPPEREAYQQSLAVVRGMLSAEDYVAAWAEGRAMTTSQAIQYALACSTEI